MPVHPGDLEVWGLEASSRCRSLLVYFTRSIGLLYRPPLGARQGLLSSRHPAAHLDRASSPRRAVPHLLSIPEPVRSTATPRVSGA